MPPPLFQHRLTVPPVNRTAAFRRSECSHILCGPISLCLSIHWRNLAERRPVQSNWRMCSSQGFHGLGRECLSSTTMLVRKSEQRWALLFYLKNFIQLGRMWAETNKDTFATWDAARLSSFDHCCLPVSSSKSIWQSTRLNALHKSKRQSSMSTIGLFAHKGLSVARHRTWPSFCSSRDKSEGAMRESNCFYFVTIWNSFEGSVHFDE